MLLKHYMYLETIRRSLVVLHVDLCSYLTRCIYICIISWQNNGNFGFVDVAKQMDTRQVHQTR